MRMDSFRRMQSSVSTRHLSPVPFFAADAVLLLTALLVAWRTPDALTGGPLLAVVLCVALGAVLAVAPFLINDARAREAELARRQAELAELVNTTTATASRWGAQWAAAATGLEDAAGLASRSIAAAERLPEIFNEQAEALAAGLTQAGREAQARSAALETSGAEVAEWSARAAATAADMRATLAGYSDAGAKLRAEREALASVLVETTAAAAKAETVRETIDARMASVPAAIETAVQSRAAEAGVRLDAAAAAVEARLVALETSLAALAERWQRLAETPVPTAPAAKSVSIAPAVVEAAPVALPEPAAETVVPMPSEPAAAEPAPAARVETIMDPFLIPDDGYAALAEAMDLKRS